MLVKDHWFYFVDWVLLGYFLFLIGSILYVAQSWLAYNHQADDYTYQTQGNLGVASSAVYMIEAALYLLGWALDKLHLQQMQSNFDRSQSRYYSFRLSKYYLSNAAIDWDFCGNLLLFISAIGYQIAAIGWQQWIFIEQVEILDITLAFLSLLISFFYFLAIVESVDVAQTPDYLRPIIDNPHRCTLYFESSIDWYLLATVFFIISSVLYCLTSIYEVWELNSSHLNLATSLCLVFDGCLYIIAGLQDRKRPDEIPLWSRQSPFLLEYHDFVPTEQMDDSQKGLLEGGEKQNHLQNYNSIETKQSNKILNI
jgi:hypothetical protein